MAVVWSWAFGNETKATLEDYMGFYFPRTGGTQAPATGATNVYSYASFPGTKYSWQTSSERSITFPGEMPGAGRVAGAVKYTGGTWNYSSGPLLEIRGTVDPNDMWAYIYFSSTGVASAIVDNTFSGTVSIPANDWVYLMIDYDMTVNNQVTASFYKDGALFAGPTTDASGPGAAETAAKISSGGFGSSNGLTAQVIGYDTGTTAAQAATPYFVTRLEPNDDTSETGVWTPSTGSTNVGVTAGAYDNATYTQEATPSSGDDVVTEVNNLTTQLGVTAGLVLGATNHTYSSGTNIQAFASVRDSGATYTNGATVVPDQNDTTYAYATTTFGLSGTSTINVKYEVV